MRAQTPIDMLCVCVFVRVCVCVSYVLVSERAPKRLYTGCCQRKLIILLVPPPPSLSGTVTLLMFLFVGIRSLTLTLSCIHSALASCQRNPFVVQFSLLLGPFWTPPLALVCSTPRPPSSLRRMRDAFSLEVSVHGKDSALRHASSPPSTLPTRLCHPQSISSLLPLFDSMLSLPAIPGFLGGDSWGRTFSNDFPGLLKRVIV